MIQLQPNSLTLKPKPRAYTAKDFPLKRAFNDYGYFELSGSAVTTKAERDLLDKQYRWDTLAVLSLFGLSDYVARNRSQPKHSLITHDLYNSTFEFELKRLDGIAPGGNALVRKESFAVNASGDLLYYADADYGLSYSLSGYDLIATRSSLTRDYAVLAGDTVKRVTVDNGDSMAFFVIDAHGNLIFQADPALGLSAQLNANGELLVAYDATIGAVQTNAVGDVTWRRVSAGGSAPVLGCPLVDGFADNRVEFRTAQQFSSGRIRQVGKRAGFLREVSFRQDLTADGAAEFVRFYRDYDHEPLTLAWVTAQFGAARRFVFGSSPWEIKATGSTFDLSVQGFIV